MRTLLWLLLWLTVIALVWIGVHSNDEAPPATSALATVPGDASTTASDAGKPAAAQAELLRAVKAWQEARFAASNALVAAAVDGANARNAGPDARRQALESSRAYVFSMQVLSTRAVQVAKLAVPWQLQGHTGAALLLDAMQADARNDAAEAASPPYMDNRLQELPPYLAPDSRFAEARDAIADNVEAIARLRAAVPAVDAVASSNAGDMKEFHARVLARGPFQSRATSSNFQSVDGSSLSKLHCLTTVDLAQGAPPEPARALNLRRRQACDGGEDRDMTTRLLLTRANAADEMVLEASGVAQSCTRADGKACDPTQAAAASSGRIALASDEVLVLELSSGGKPGYAVVTSR